MKRRRWVEGEDWWSEPATQRRLFSPLWVPTFQTRTCQKGGSGIYPLILINGVVVRRAITNTFRLAAT